ncbi:unnamed protein product [Dicrocoelium dendriticum]|nr:unnamed protein product [Dicrocoelium dendriticum]
MDAEHPDGLACKRSMHRKSCDVPRKKAKLLSDACRSDHSSVAEMSGWQAALGASLADQLERLTVQRSLTARQVKKLLRAVLTNDDVVSAFRRYINLSEPETGELSISTKRKAKALGLLPASDGAQLDSAFEPRVITRSLARSIRRSLRDYLPAGASGSGRKPSTILEMEFPNEDESDRNAVPCCESADHDEDYQPGPLDWYLLERDRALEGACTNLSRSRLDSSVSHSSHTENSTQSISSVNMAVPDCPTGASDFCNQSSKWASAAVVTHTVQEASHSTGHLNWSDVQRTPLTAESDYGAYLEEHEVDADKSTPSTPLSRSVDESLNDQEDRIEDNEDDDDVYTEFLRSLFAPCENVQATPNTNDTPCKQSDYSNSSHCLVTAQQDSTPPPCAHSPNHPALNTESDADDDPNDPEFDVMAELDKVSREDFIDELRDDRAVRVSKMEAKSLHQDLRDLFSDEEEQSDGGSSAMDRPSASAVFAMKSQCHRLLHTHRVPKSEPPDPANKLGHRDEQALGGVSFLPTPDSRTPRCFSQINSPSLTADESLQLQRQIGMHVQLLTTNFLCSYDFPHLHSTVTRPCACALKELASRRDAFDLMAQQRIGLDTSHASIRSCYWSCSCLDDAVQLITEYAGLSILPRIPKSTRRSDASSAVPDSSTSLLGNQKRSGLGNLPLPLCLIHLMLNNPIWSYPYLMPASLPALHEPSDHFQSRRRVAFHSSEDALILLGLADFCNTSTQPSTETRGDGEQQSTHGRYLTYRLVRKHLLPHRNLLQLRTRRWNLISGRAAMRRKHSLGLTPIPTRRLLQLYSNCTPLDREFLHSLADEVATSSIPHHIPFRYGCLSSMTPKELFGPDCLPIQAGYETVLLNVITERCYRGELSKRIHDILTDFVQHAECLWWSNSTVTPSSNQNAFKSEPVPLQHRTSEQPILKPEEVDANHMAPSMLGGPTFLPALPVEFTPDGNVILNTRREPTLIELHMDEGTSDATRTPRTITNVSKYVKCVNPLDETKPSITDHIETLLSRIRSQGLDPTRPATRRLTTGLTIKTIAQLSNAPRLTGKLPLPPLHKPSIAVAKRLAYKRYKSGRRRRNRRPLSSIIITQPTKALQDTGTAAVTSVAKTGLTPITSVPKVVTRSSCILSTARQEQRSPKSLGDLGLLRCQEYVDSLIKQFHFGMDKLLNVHGTSVLGPARFPPLAKASLFHANDPPPPHPARSDYLTAPIERWITQQQPQQISVFPTSCLLTAGRFLNRCKARGEATSADLFTLASSAVPQRQSVADEHDVHRARSILDRCRAYLSPGEYGAIVFTLRRLNHLVHSSNGSGLTLSQCKKHILTGLVSILDKLKTKPSLWGDFICLLTADQAQQLGLLSTYFDLTRVNRAQRILQDLIPRGKRFWRRLRNLADSCYSENRRPTSDGTKGGNCPTSTTATVSPLSATASAPPKGRRKPFRRSRIVRFPVTKTWALLESTWRNRPVLLSQLACLLNVTHKPYSGFDQSFEEIDLLTRQPLGKPSFVASESASPTTLSPALADPFTALSGSEDGWEVCTSLSAATKYYGFEHTSSASWRNCPCPCHPNSMMATSGKSSKAGSRHCISCSLRVHRGIVYVGECNIRLRPVHITWPPGFKPKASLLPASSSKVSQRSKAKQILHCRYGIIHCSGYSSTRATLAQLAELHARSTTTDLEDNQASILPDMARRHVAIEYVPPPRPNFLPQPTLSTVTECLNGHDEELEPSPSEAADDSLGLGSPDCAARSNLSPLPKRNVPSHWFIEDDDAACFNTEAFASSTTHTALPESSPANSFKSAPGMPDVIDNSWDLEEDRQLLEYTKSRGRYSTSMFADLAKCWVPKPFPISRPRKAHELEARFKRLMLLTLGDAYDPILFRSPERESSEDN